MTMIKQLLKGKVSLLLKNIVYSNIVYCKKSLREQNTEFYESFAMHMF